MFSRPLSGVLQRHDYYRINTYAHWSSSEYRHTFNIGRYLAHRWRCADVAWKVWSPRRQPKPLLVDRSRERHDPVVHPTTAKHLLVTAVVLRVDPWLVITLTRKQMHHSFHVIRRESVNPIALDHR